jgi:hypothetical protein
MIPTTDNYQKDKAGEFYEDFDEESGLWCVFGSETGHAYASYSDEEEARSKAEEMNSRKR